jgi:predicted amidophosphoribosyltransferase
MRKCIKCANMIDDDDRHKTCPSCLEKNRVFKLRLRKDREERGVCTQCGKKRDSEVFVLCANCRNKKYIHHVPSRVKRGVTKTKPVRVYPTHINLSKSYITKVDELAARAHLTRTDIMETLISKYISRVQVW